MKRKVDSSYSMKTVLRKYSASHHSSSVIITIDDITSGVVIISDGTQHSTFRFNSTTLDCLFEALKLRNNDEEKADARSS